MRQTVCVLAGIILCITVYPQFSISGKITDESGNFLPGANVFLKDTFKGTITDSRGTFILDRVSPGEKVIQVRYLGYEPEEKNINISGDLKLDFVLRRTSLMGEEVIIKGTRAGEKDPVAFSLIRKEEIIQRNLGQDMPFILALSPSFVSTSDAGTGVGYTNFRIRGTDANRINMTVNGIPLNDAESHSVFFVDLPDFAGSTENIQIQRGVGTSTNGAAAFGASINFQTLSLNKEPYGELSSSYGSFNTLKSSVSFGTGLIKKRYSFDGRLSWLHSDGYIDRASSDLNSWFISGTSVTENSLVKLIMFSGNEKTYQAWDGVPGYLLDSLRTFNGKGMYTDEDGNIRYYDNETDNYIQNHYQLHYSREVSSYVDFTAALHLTRGIGYYEQFKEDQDLSGYETPYISLPEDTTIITDLIRRKWLDNYFYGAIFSLNIRKDRFDAVIGGGYSVYDGDHFGTLIWAKNPGSFEINHKWYENTGKKTDFNSYARLNYSLRKSLNVYADMQIRGIKYKIDGVDDDRRNISQNHTFLFFNPKLGLKVKINENQTGYFSFSVAHREPNRDNYVDAPLNQPYPEPELLLDYESGYRFNLGNLQAGLNLFYMDYKKQLVLTGEINDVGAPIMTNVKKSYRAGIEAEMVMKISEKIEWGLNLNLSKNKIRNFSTFVDNWDYWDDPENEPFQFRYDLGSTDIAFSPAIVAASSIKASPAENLMIGFQSKYVGKQYIDNTASSDRQLDAWFVNDLRICYMMMTKSSVGIDFNIFTGNIFNEKYESNAWVYRYFWKGNEYKDEGYFPQAGRYFLAGITLKF